MGVYRTTLAIEKEERTTGCVSGVATGGIASHRMPHHTFDVAVIGAGPAGLSAALVLGRARRRVVVCDAGSPRNATAVEMHGLLSRDGMPPAHLLAEGRAQLQRYSSVELALTPSASVEPSGDHFAVDVGDNQVRARRVILATGMIEALPALPGLRERWGTSVFSCPYCDGWEVRDRPLAIAGDRDDLVPLAQELSQWSRDLTIYGCDLDACSAQEQAWIRAAGVVTRASRIVALEGAAAPTLRLASGERAGCDALFLCVPLVQRSPLAAKLGCALTHTGRIEVNRDQRTSVAGVYAAGDASGHVHQVVTAAASGAMAGMSVNDDLSAEDNRNLIAAVPT
jgi:thioredoxin reductase